MDNFNILMADTFASFLWSTGTEQFYDMEVEDLFHNFTDPVMRALFVGYCFGVGIPREEYNAHFPDATGETVWKLAETICAGRELKKKLAH